MSHLIPTPMKTKYFTPGVIAIAVVALAGLVFLAARFIFGLGAVTNLNNQFPWGIWIGIDVASGVALAAGGFTTAALGHIMYKDKYEVLVRPALLTAMIGYTFVALSVATDLGRYYSVWHPLIYWNGSSVLFEVGICVLTYVTVLYIEFLPIVCERFIGKVNLPGFLKSLNRPVDKLLRFLNRGLEKTMFVFIIAGVVLSCLHQSSLGTLMIIAGPKMHPLWQTPILPLLFLISAIAVGFPMVIFESIISSKSFKLEPEREVLSDLARVIAPILALYLAFKIGDMFIRETYVYLTQFTTESVMYTIEIVIGVILPLRLLISEQVRKSITGLFITSSLIIFGVFINRFNDFIVAYNPPYAANSYFPSIGEILVTLAFIALEILIFRAFVMVFPVISAPSGIERKTFKYLIGRVQK